MAVFLTAGLIVVGFISYNFVICCVGSAVTLKLKDLGASAKTIALIMTTISSVFNLTICPVVSFKSDRYRSKWGRRIPFILGSMPMFALAILLLAFSDDLGGLSARLLAPWCAASPASFTIAVIGIIMVMYYFFYMIVGSIIYYVYNDVIPEQFLSRAVAAVSIGTSIVGFLFNLLLFRYSLSHFKWILIAAAVVYVVGITAMCLGIKEPEYPAPDEVEKPSSSRLKGIRTFLQESFSHPFYLFNFIAEATGAIALAIGNFTLFFFMFMGLSLEAIGRQNAIVNVVGTVLAFAGAACLSPLVDRFHAMRMNSYLHIFMPLVFAANLKWIFIRPPAQVIVLSMLFICIAKIYYTKILALSAMPRLFRTYPKSRFGQFASAGAMLRSILVLIFSIIAGVVVDFLRYQLKMGDEAFVYIAVWEVFWYVVSAFFTFVVYRLWIKLGADSGYRAPAPWSPEKFEELPQSEVQLPSYTVWKWIALCFDLIYLITFAGTLFFLWRSPANFDDAGKILLFGALPVSIVAGGYYLFCRKSIFRNFACLRQGLPMTSGIPHHIVMIIFLVNQLVMTGASIWQTVICQPTDPVSAAKLWLFESVTALAIAAIIHLCCRMEKGIPESVKRI